MPGAFVQQREGSSNLTARPSIACSASLSSTAGNLLYFELTYFSGAAKTITYPATWGTVVEIDNFFNATDGAGMRRGYIANCSAASGTGSCSFSANVDFPAIRISEYSGLATSSPLVGTGTLNRQVNPGTGAGVITVSVTPSSQPALVLGTSFALVAQNWDTAVSDTGRTRVWDYAAGTTFSAKPQDARVTSTSAKALTWTTNAGTDTYWSWSVAFAEPGGAAAVTLPQLERGIRGLERGMNYGQGH